MSSALSGEARWIAMLRAQAQPRAGGLRLGIGDDCAVLRPRAGEEIVVTTDFSLEGVHFRRDRHPPESVGHRCLARGLSDAAAMGARPLAAFLSLAVPRDPAGSWARRFADGLLALAAVHGIPLAGGDTAESPRFADAPGPVLADIVVLGAVATGRALLRSGARPGDLLYVTGSLGGAAAELAAVLEGPARFASARRAPARGEALRPHLYPQPRIAVGRRLLATASAAMDLSDGLSTDLGRLCEASAVTAEIEEALLPIAPGATLDQALNGGEDYELLFTAPAGARVPRQVAGVPIRRIGCVTAPAPAGRRAKSAVTLIGADGRRSPLRAGGWQHLG